MHGRNVQPSSVFRQDNIKETCDYTSTLSWMYGREAPVVRRPPTTCVDDPLLPLREPPRPCSTHQLESHPRLIRARPLGESIELHTDDDSDASDGVSSRWNGGGAVTGWPPAQGKGAGSCLTKRRRRACGHGVARGWSRFVAAARAAIDRPPLEPDDDDGGVGVGVGVDGDGVGGDGGGEGAHEYAPSVSFLQGLWQLSRVALWDIIHPDSRFRTVWDVLVVFALLYVAVITTYLLCFEFEQDNKISVFEVLDALINAAFLLDILFNFRTALRRGEDAARRNALVTDRRLLALNYLTGWFTLDILAALPWGLITSSLSSFMQLLKLLRLIRLLRLMQVSRSMQRSRLYQNMEQTQGAAVLRVVSYVLGGIIVLHMSASAWFFVAVIQDKDLNGTWAAAAGLQDASNFERYLTSLYFVVITYTTVGYGDVFPVTTAERFMTCVGMLIGVVTLGYIISTANSIAGQANKYEVAKGELLDGVEEFLAAQALPTGLATRVKNYYCYVASKQFNDPDDEKLVAGLPCDLRRDVLRGMHARLIGRVPFLRDAARQHEALVLELSAALKLEFYGKRECVVMEGGWDTELYFVTEGHLKVRQYDPSKGREAAGAGAALLAPPQRLGGASAAWGSRGTPTGPTQGAVTPTATVTIASAPSTPAAATATATAAAQEPYGRGGGPTAQHRAPNTSGVRRSLAAAASRPVVQAGGSRGDAVLEMYGGSLIPPQPIMGSAPGNAPLAPGDVEPALPNGETSAAAAAAAAPPESSPGPSGSPFAAAGMHAAGALCGGGGGGGGPPASRAPGEELSPLPSSLPRTQSPSQTERRRKWRMSYDYTVPYITLRTLKPGHYFGEYGCLTGCPRTASVVAVRMSELYALRREHLAAAMVRWPGLAEAWKACEEYGARERERLRLCLQGGRAPRAMSLSPSHAGGADGGGADVDVDADVISPYEVAFEAAISSRKRYQDFLSNFGGGVAGGGGGAEDPGATAAAAEATGMMSGTTAADMSMSGAD